MSNSDNTETDENDISSNEDPNTNDIDQNKLEDCKNKN